MFVDYDQANSIVMTAVLLGLPLFVFFGWLSDRVGRKYILLSSLLMGILCFRPVYEQMYQVTNLQHKVENKSAFIINTKRQILSANESLITITTERSYTDGTILHEVKKEIASSGKTLKTDILKIIKINVADKRTLIFLVFILMIVVALSYGPLAAYLVEMFPLKIRYSSLSLPYHIGYGIFGGMAQVITTYLIEKAYSAHKTDYYLAGINYPIVLMAVSFVIGMLYLKDNKSHQRVMATTSAAINKLKKSVGSCVDIIRICCCFLWCF